MNNNSYANPAKNTIAVTQIQEWVAGQAYDSDRAIRVGTNVYVALAPVPSRPTFNPDDWQYIGGKDEIVKHTGVGIPTLDGEQGDFFYDTSLDEYTYFCTGGSTWKILQFTPDNPDEDVVGTKELAFTSTAWAADNTVSFSWEDLGLANIYNVLIYEVKGEEKINVPCTFKTNASGLIVYTGDRTRFSGVIRAMSNVKGSDLFEGGVVAYNSKADLQAAVDDPEVTLPLENIYFARLEESFYQVKDGALIPFISADEDLFIHIEDSIIRSVDDVWVNDNIPLNTNAEVVELTFNYDGNVTILGSFAEAISARTSIKKLIFNVHQLYFNGGDTQHVEFGDCLLEFRPIKFLDTYSPQFIGLNAVLHAPLIYIEGLMVYLFNTREIGEAFDATKAVGISNGYSRSDYSVVYLADSYVRNYDMTKPLHLHTSCSFIGRNSTVSINNAYEPITPTIAYFDGTGKDMKMRVACPDFYDYTESEERYGSDLLKGALNTFSKKLEFDIPSLQDVLDNDPGLIHEYFLEQMALWSRVYGRSDYGFRQITFTFKDVYSTYGIFESAQRILHIVFGYLNVHPRAGSFNLDVAFQNFSTGSTITSNSGTINLKEITDTYSNYTSSLNLYLVDWNISVGHALSSPLIKYDSYKTRLKFISTNIQGPTTGTSGEAFIEKYSSSNSQDGGIDGELENSILDFSARITPLAKLMDHQPTIDSDGFSAFFFGDGKNYCVTGLIALDTNMATLSVLDVKRSSDINTFIDINLDAPQATKDTDRDYTKELINRHSFPDAVRNFGQGYIGYARNTSQVADRLADALTYVQSTNGAIGVTVTILIQSYSGNIILTEDLFSDIILRNSNLTINFASAEPSRETGGDAFGLVDILFNDTLTDGWTPKFTFTHLAVAIKKVDCAYLEGAHWTFENCRVTFPKHAGVNEKVNAVRMHLINTVLEECLDNRTTGTGIVLGTAYSKMINSIFAMKINSTVFLQTDTGTSRSKFNFTNNILPEIWFIESTNPHVLAQNPNPYKIGTKVVDENYLDLPDTAAVILTLETSYTAAGEIKMPTNFPNLKKLDLYITAAAGINITIEGFPGFTNTPGGTDLLQFRVVSGSFRLIQENKDI